MQSDNIHNLSVLRNVLSKITYLGYDHNFLYGWLIGYLSYIQDEEEDELIPTGLILNEEKLHKYQNELEQTINVTLKEYEHLANIYYEKNQDIDVSSLIDTNEKINLLKFLYGYLSKMLLNDLEFDNSELINLIDDEYYPQLFKLVASFVTLTKQIKLADCSSYFMDDIYDLSNELQTMWEAEGAEDMSEYFENYPIKVETINLALDCLFLTMRKIDEIRYVKQ